MSNRLKNMKKIAFIVDTSSSVKVNEFKDVYVLPLTINVTNTKTNEIKSYHDTVDITNKDVAKFLSDKDYTVATSQAATGEITNLVEKIYDKYDEIYVLPIPLYLSGSAKAWDLCWMSKWCLSLAWIRKFQSSPSCHKYEWTFIQKSLYFHINNKSNK